jgi:hypothetical protein
MFEAIVCTIMTLPDSGFKVQEPLGPRVFWRLLADRRSARRDERR